MTHTNPKIWAAGSKGEYHWLTTGQDDLGTLITRCPQIFLGRYLAVTSLDSGPLDLNEEEIASGWQRRGDIAYSPRIESVEKLRYGVCAGYDEWYVSESPLDLGQIIAGNIFEARLGPGRVQAFVNFIGFGFHDPEMDSPVQLFWAQLEWIHPMCYVGDGSLLNFVCRDKEQFSTVLNALPES
jgi:hypothetical protein